MLDRRTFLKTSLATSASMIALPGAAIAAPWRADLEGTTVETLDRFSDLHPGFAYFAGLPGHLGMPFAQRAHWAATRAAKEAFAELQTQCGIACFMIGTRQADDATRGTTAMVLSALGSAPAGARLVMPYGTTVALVMPETAWQTLDLSTRAAITTASARMVGDAPHQNAPRDGTPPNALTSTINRISEAVVASIANHDALTRRINASYFAELNAGARLRSKNAV